MRLGAASAKPFGPVSGKNTYSCYLSMGLNFLKDGFALGLFADTGLNGTDWMAGGINWGLYAGRKLRLTADVGLGAARMFGDKIPLVGDSRSGVYLRGILDASFHYKIKLLKAAVGMFLGGYVAAFQNFYVIHGFLVGVSASWYFSLPEAIRGPKKARK